MYKKIIKFPLLCLLLFFAAAGFNTAQAQVKKPVTVSTVLTPPYSLYLDDYVTPGSQKCRVNMVFNDYNETSWDVYLHLTIESQNLRMTTKENFRPAAPITLYTGENRTLSGDELYPYFNYNNLDFAGITKSEVERLGRLPEGFYTFSFEVRDYRTGVALSSKSIFVANLQLNEPPKIIAPAKGSIIEPSETQNIVFQWLTNGLMPGENNYKLHLYELTDTTMSPENAIQNNGAFKIFESNEVPISTFQYSIANPLLEKGKKYIYYVEAVSTEGKELFKNGGVSETGWFHYGYPEDGHINLLFPEHEHGFTLREDKYFRWQAPTNLTDQQLYNYQMKIVKMAEDEDPEQALEKDPYFELVTGPTSFSQTWFANLDTVFFATGQKYAWQVKSYTNETQIAQSDINTFTGPPYLESFKAGNHKVTVTKTTSNSFDNLSGEGTIKFSKSGKRHKVYFENIRVERSGTEIFLREGRCVAKCETKRFKLSPYHKDNGNAWFAADSVLLDKENLKIKGHVEWDLPHPVLSEKKAVVVSETVSLKYNNFALLGNAKINKRTLFKLLSPLNFNLILNKRSYFFVKHDKFRLHFDGRVELPTNIMASEESVMHVPFVDQRQLYFIEMQDQVLKNRIRLVKRTQIDLGPQRYFIDFSEKQSPGKKSGNPRWKGVYFATYSLDYPVDLDDRNQLKGQKDISHTLNNNDKPAYKAWATSNGLQFFADYAFDQQDIGYFNTFPSKLSHLLVDIKNSTVTDGVFNGAIKIPIIDEEKDFTYYVPLTDNGFMEGFLDEDLTGKTFVYNAEGGEQKMIITINRAVFQKKRWLDMNIDLDWPFTNIKLEALNHFRIWGDYEIGFVKPKGIASLVVQKQGDVNDFKITMDYIGCGRQGDLYAIGTSADIIMGEDVAGKEGAPKANLYSISQNALLTGTHGYGGGEEYINQLITDKKESKLGEGGFDVGAQSDIDNLDSLSNAINERLAAQEETMKSQLAADAQSIAGEMFEQNDQQSGYTVDFNNPRNSAPTYELEVDKAPEDVTREDLLLIIDGISVFFNQEQQAKLDELKSFIASVPEEQIANIYMQLRDLDGFVKMLLKGKVDEYIAKLNNKITSQTDSVKKHIVTYIERRRDSITLSIAKPVGRLIDSLGTEAADAVGDVSEKVAFDRIILQVTNSAKTAVIDEITNSVNKSVEDNLTQPIVAFIDTSVNNRITGFIDSTLSSAGYALIEDQSLEVVDGKEILENAEAIIPDVAGDFKTTFIGNNGDMVVKRISGLVEESVTNYSWESVGRAMIEDIIKQAAIEFAKSELADEVTDFADDLMEDETTSQIIGNIADNVDLDFDNVGDKLKNGEIDKIIKFDPSFIRVETKVADFEGYVNFTNDDPMWGDSWQAELIARLKIEPSFQVNAKYVNGTSSYKADAEYKYWFLEIGVEGLNLPMGALPLTFDGAAGRVYHHMAKTEPGSDEYMPDVNTRYGVGLQVDFFDTPSVGSVLAFDVGMEVAIMDNGFIYEMNGNAWVANTTENGKIVKSVALGTGYLMFNSAEKHFLANLTATVEVESLLCAGGEMNVDISKEYWRVSIGTRKEPFYLDLFCMGSPFIQSWFDIDQDRLDAGLIVSIDINAEAPWIGPKLCRVKPWARIFFEMGTTAIVYWKPFAIEEARVWLDLYVGVGVTTKCIRKKKHTIAAVSIGGELMFRTIPETVLYGSAYGEITIVGMSVGFELDVEKEF